MGKTNKKGIQLTVLPVLADDMRLSSVIKTVGGVSVDVPWEFPAFTTASYLTPGLR